MGGQTGCKAANQKYIDRWKYRERGWPIGHREKMGRGYMNSATLLTKTLQINAPAEVIREDRSEKEERP